MNQTGGATYIASSLLFLTCMCRGHVLLETATAIEAAVTEVTCVWEYPIVRALMSRPVTLRCVLFIAHRALIASPL